MSLEAIIKSQAKTISILRWRTKFYCPIVSSKIIKKTICDRCDELGVTLAEVCAKAGVSYKAIKTYYIDYEDPESRPGVRSTDLEKIGEVIGIKFRITVVMADVKSIDRREILNVGYIRG